MAELQPIIVFHGRHFVRHLGICNPICVKLFQVMSGVIPSILKKTTSLSQTIFLASTNAAHTHTDTHTHTYDDSIRRNAMRCISPKNQYRSKSVPVKTALVQISTSKSQHCSKSAPVKVSTGQSQFWSKWALVQISTGQSQHWSKLALVKVSTGQSERWSKSAHRSQHW